MALVILVHPLFAELVFSPTIPNGNELLIIQGNTLASTIPHFTLKFAVLGVLTGKEDTIDLLGTISCLIQFESNGNPDAIGDNGKAISVLQFHQPTFDMFSEKYNLVLDIHKPEDQVLLAYEMLRDDFNNIKHWSVWRKCQ